MAEGGKGGGGQPNADDTKYIAAFIVAVIAIWLLWTVARKPIVLALFGVVWVQYKALDVIGLLRDEYGRNMKGFVEGMLTGAQDAWTVEWQEIALVHADIGSRTVWFVVALVVAMAVVATFKMRGDGFRRVYTLTGRSQETIFRFLGKRIDNKLLQFALRLVTTILLIKGKVISERKEWAAKGMSFAHYQASHWKVALAGAHFDPDKEDANQEPARTPMEWLRDNKVRLTKREGIDEEAASRALKAQLGPTWQGVEKAPAHVQAICVLAALNVKRDKKVNSLRDRLTEIYVLGGGDEKAVREALAPFLADKKISGAINKRGSRHAFTNTAAIGIYGWGGPMKEWGGGDAGVLSSSMFRWLKKADRTLWYCLNNVGRRAFHIEGAGAVAHFFAERVVGNALGEEKCDTALEGLLKYLDEQAIEDLDLFFRVEREF